MIIIVSCNLAPFNWSEVKNLRMGENGKNKTGLSGSRKYLYLYLSPYLYLYLSPYLCRYMYPYLSLNVSIFDIVTVQVHIDIPPQLGTGEDFKASLSLELMAKYFDQKQNPS